MKQRRGLLTELSQQQARLTFKRREPGIRHSLTKEHGHVEDSVTVGRGYPSPLYDELYKMWRVVSFDIANHAAGGRSKARKQETLWMNWW